MVTSMVKNPWICYQNYKSKTLKAEIFNRRFIMACSNRSTLQVIHNEVKEWLLPHFQLLSVLECDYASNNVVENEISWIATAFQPRWSWSNFDEMKKETYPVDWQMRTGRWGFGATMNRISESISMITSIGESGINKKSF